MATQEVPHGASNKTSRLLALPKELRLLILEAYLATVQLPYQRRIPYLITNATYREHPLAILGVNKSLRDDAAQAFLHIFQDGTQDLAIAHKKVPANVNLMFDDETNEKLRLLYQLREKQVIQRERRLLIDTANKWMDRSQEHLVQSLHGLHDSLMRGDIVLEGGMDHVKLCLAIKVGLAARNFKALREAVCGLRVVKGGWTGHVAGDGLL